MADLTSADLLKVTRNAYKRIQAGRAKRVDIRKRPMLRFFESRREDTTFEGGAIVYPIMQSFNDAGTTWVGDSEIEAFDPDFSLNLQYGYFNFTTAITIKHDMLTQLGFSVIPNGDGLLESRAMGYDQAYKIQNYVKNLVTGFIDNHDKFLDRLLHRAGTAQSTDPVGVLGILSQTPTTGTVGGLSRTTYTILQNQIQFTMVTGAGGNFRVLFTQGLRLANQYSSANGVDGEVDVFFAGKAFIDAYTQWGEANGYRVTRDLTTPMKKYDWAIPDTAVQFENIPIVWDPTMEDVDTVETYSPTCTKMCIGFNSKTWHYKALRGKYKKLTSPADPPKQRVTREDIDTTAHIACDAPASNILFGAQ